MRIPKLLGTCVDNLKKLRDEKAALKKKHDAEMKKITDQITALENHLIETIPKSKLNGAMGKLAKVSLIKKDVPTVDDWSKVYDYIGSHDAFDMMQRRVNVKAIEDRWKAGEKIPGVTTFTKVTLSVTKV